MSSKMNDFLHSIIIAVALLVMAAAKFKGIDLGDSLNTLLQITVAGAGGSLVRSSPVSGS